MATKKAYEAASKYWQSVIDQQIDVVQEIIEDGSYKEDKQKAEMFFKSAMAIEHMQKVPELIDRLKNEKKK
jgi:hypothetical protein|tara:strand:+ start:1128 stop:1340 length:213 start_codon:yes stop_codon:yes gene_type:complete